MIGYCNDTRGVAIGDTIGDTIGNTIGRYG